MNPVRAGRALNELHIELTERCNAHCPMCGRFDTDGDEIAYLAGREITLDRLRAYVPVKALRELGIVRLCGNFGDPAAARDALPICEWLRSKHPGLSLQLHTNGSLRSPEWWFDLGRLFRGAKDAVVFGIDGLDDTHHVYRRGTSFERIMANAACFIRGGGRAHWTYLVFRHNEHQIDEARRRAETAGFVRFAVKSTKRFIRNESLHVRNRVPLHSTAGGPEALEPPLATNLRNPAVERLRILTESAADTDELVSTTAIDCHALRRASLYLSAGGLLLPCCWLGASIAHSSSVRPGGLLQTLSRAGMSIDDLDLNKRSFDDINSDTKIADLIARGWAQGPDRLRVCARTCGRDLRSFEDQFIDAG